MRFHSRDPPVAVRARARSGRTSARLPPSSSRRNAMSRRLLLALSALAALILLGVSPALAGEAAAQPDTSIAQAPAGCGAVLAAPLTPTRSTSAGPNLCAAPSPQPASEPPAFLRPAKRLGYCHCGCVNQRVCRTSDDCGGASCDQFISCC